MLGVLWFILLESTCEGIDVNQDSTQASVGLISSQKWDLPIPFPGTCLLGSAPGS